VAAHPLAVRLAGRVLSGALVAVAVTAMSGAAPAVATPPPITAALVPSYGAMWGAWAAPGDTSAVALFESTTKRRLDIVHQYHAFDTTWPTSTEYGWASGGRILFANISARYSGGVYTWSSIAAGSEDSILNGLASRLRAYGRPLFVSFDQEPEGRLGGSGFAATDYVNASRHLHNLFAADGVRNVVWVWVVSGATDATDLANFRALYPGDSYVDWIGWDPYNWNTCIHPYGWQTFDQVVAPFYNWVAGGHLSAGSAGKPYMLAEYGSVEGGAGAKGQWFLGEASTISSRPRIKAVVYFNENKDCNWPIATSSSSVAGFTSAGLSCWFNRAAPSAPTSVSASPANGAATVRWAAASSVCPITVYTIISSRGKEITTSGSTLSATFGGLANGSSYTFQVKATSVNGNSVWSALSAPVTPSGTPPATPVATPTSRASASPAGGLEKTSAVARDTNPVTSWLESHVVALPLGLAILLGLGLGAQLITARRRR
jgi:Glycosyl hydrolase family 26/Fibronectin type III domain